MILKLALLLLCLAHPAAICHSAKSTEVDRTETFAFSNYHTKINARNKESTVFLEESSFGFLNKLTVKSTDGDYEVFYSSLIDDFYKRSDGSNNCKKFSLKKDSSYLENENLNSIGFVNRYENQFKIGPSAILSIFKEDDNWIKREESAPVRGVENSVTYSNSNQNAGYFGLEDLKLDLTFSWFKENNETKLVPMKISVSGNRGNEKVELSFDYYDYREIDFDDVAASGYQVAPSVGCPELSGFFIEKRPNFSIEDKMEIEFNDVSTFGAARRERYHVDRAEKIARFESDGVHVLDEKNQVLFHTNSEMNCEIELFSSDQDFEVVKTDFFRNLKLFLDLNIESFTFIGEEVLNGYLVQKFQRISEPEHGKLGEKRTLFFKGQWLDMLVSETFDSQNVRKNMKIFDVVRVKQIGYDEEYRELFTAPSCLSKNEFQYIHLYSVPLDQDPNLPKKLAYLEEHKEDFVLSRLLENLKADLMLDLNAFSTSNLERQTNQFVVNSLVLNVENYLQNFDVISDLDVKEQPLNLNVRECAWQALESENYHGFKHCKKIDLPNEVEKCYLIDLSIPLPDESKVAKPSPPVLTTVIGGDCKTYRKKQSRRTNYVFHQLAENLTNLTKKMPYSIQLKHDVKFVFDKIRFSSGFNLIDQGRFFLFKDKVRLKEPNLELDDQNVIRLISPFDCYLQCTKQPDCSSFSFCKLKPSRFEKMSTKCQLSDRVLIGEYEHHERKEIGLAQKSLHSMWDSLKRFANGQESVEDAEENDLLVADKNCETFGVSYLKHFKSNGESLLATVDSLKSDLVNNEEECAKSCLSFNQNEANEEKCGKLEICSDGDQKNGRLQCNLKLFAADNEKTLNNTQCGYYKINNLIDYHQGELDEERGHLEINSPLKTIDACAKDCTALGDSCKEFNFCWMKTLEEYNYEDQDGYCLWRVAEKSGSKADQFNVSEKTLNCVSMIRNGHIIAPELERTLPDDSQTKVFRLKFIKERNPNELTASALKLCLFACGSIGALLGWLGFSYYEKNIGPANRAERGEFFSTRRIVQMVRRNDGDKIEIREIRETEVQVRKSGNDDDEPEQQSRRNPNGPIHSYQNPNYLSAKGAGKPIEMKRMDEDDFTDIHL